MYTINCMLYWGATGGSSISHLTCLQGERLERIWNKLKAAWNAFHVVMDGHVNYECQPHSAFAKLTDETPLAAFLGFANEDNELLKVLKALVTVQVWCRCSIWPSFAIYYDNVQNQLGIALFSVRLYKGPEEVTLTQAAVSCTQEIITPRSYVHRVVPLALGQSLRVDVA